MNSTRVRLKQGLKFDATDEHGSNRTSVRLKHDARRQIRERRRRFNRTSVRLKQPAGSSTESQAASTARAFV